MSVGAEILKFNHKLRNVVPLNRRNKHFTFFLVLMATCCDNYIVGVGMTTLFSVMQKFDVNSVMASWTLSAYTLTLASFIMLAGKLTDVLGPEIVFLTGVFFTGICSLICACIEKQIIVLIVFRAIQGIFAAVLIPSSFAIAGVYYQGKYLGYAFNCLVVALTAIFGIATLTGGAFSLTAIGYRSAYFFTFAFVTLIAILLYFTMYPIPRTEDHKNLKLKDLDFPGAIILVVGVLLVILGLTEGGESWKRPSSYVPLIVGVLAIIAVVLFEVVYISNFQNIVNRKIEETEDLNANAQTETPSHLKKTNELVRSVDSSNLMKCELTKDWRYRVQILLPREVFKIPSIIQYMFATFFFFIGFIAFLVAAIQYYQFVLEDSPLIASVKLIPASIGLVVGAIINQDAFVYKLGMKNCLLFSQLVDILTTVWFTRHSITKTNNYWKYEAFSLLFYGYAANLYFAIYINATLRRTPIHLQGVASGLLQAISQVGISLGNSLLSSILGELELPTSFAEQLALQKKLMNPFYLVLATHAVTFIIIIFIKDQKSADDSHKQEKEIVSEA